MPQLCFLKTRYNCTAKPVLSSWLNILSSIRLVPRNKLLIIDIWTVLLEYIHNCLSMLIILLEYIDFHTQGECSIRVYRSNIDLLCGASLSQTLDACIFKERSYDSKVGCFLNFFGTPIKVSLDKVQCSGCLKHTVLICDDHDIDL